MMEKIILKILEFFCTVVVPLAGGWAVMSYHKYSFEGIAWGVFITLFLWGALLIGKDKEK